MADGDSGQPARRGRHSAEAGVPGGGARAQSARAKLPLIIPASQPSTARSVGFVGARSEPPGMRAASARPGKDRGAADEKGASSSKLPRPMTGDERRRFLNTSLGPPPPSDA